MKIKYLFILVLAFSNLAYACTDFILVNENKNAVVGRSMEFGINLNSTIVIIPKGQRKVSLIKNKRGLSWTSKYGFVGVRSLDIIVDGMNEKGLSFALLWFPGAKYPENNLTSISNTLDLKELGNWTLGSFSTVDEVKTALLKIDLWVHEIQKLHEIPPVHFIFHDKKGKSIVVEFIDGKIQILDNPIGVLTNDPKFEWHVTNLRNYINLSNINKGKAVFDGTVISPTGQGTGLLGLPGDWTPPSRFVRIAVIKDFVKKTKTAQANVNLAFHLLNTVDIPYGVVRSFIGKEYDYTKWAVVKDLSNQRFYYRTYKDLRIRGFDLQKELLKNQERRIPMLDSAN